jgi:hypothetical protein
MEYQFEILSDAQTIFERNCQQRNIVLHFDGKFEIIKKNGGLGIEVSYLRYTLKNNRKYALMIPEIIKQTYLEHIINLKKLI